MRVWPSMPDTAQHARHRSEHDHRPLPCSHLPQEGPALAPISCLGSRHRSVAQMQRLGCRSGQATVLGEAWGEREQQLSVLLRKTSRHPLLPH